VETDYLIDVKDTEDNLPSSTVTAIVQTPEGYLWVGTYNGLARFDGARFVTFDRSIRPSSARRVSRIFTSTRAARFGSTPFAAASLRIATVCFGSNGRINPPSTAHHPRGVFVEPGRVCHPIRRGVEPVTDRSDHQLAGVGSARRRAPLLSVRGWQGAIVVPDARRAHHSVIDNRFSQLPDNGGLGNKRVYQLAKDAQGRVWAGADGEIAFWNGRVFESMTRPTEDWTRGR